MNFKRVINSKKKHLKISSFVLLVYEFLTVSIFEIEIYRSSCADSKKVTL